MKSIEVVFTKSTKKFPIFSWAVRLWTWKPYSHVACKFDIEQVDSPVYFQSNDKKVNWEFEDYFLEDHIVVRSHQIKIDDETYKELIEAAWRQSGASYGYMQNVGIFLVDIARILGFKATNPWKKGLNCSELIYSYILKKLYPELDNDPETIKPHHIERIIKEKLDG